RGSRSVDGNWQAGSNTWDRRSLTPGSPAVSNGKQSDDRFLAAAKRTKSEGGKATRKR
ncbi:Hypothetical predicted protein, partial [Pelobates cultripes]